MYSLCPLPPLCFYFENLKDGYSAISCHLLFLCNNSYLFDELCKVVQTVILLMFLTLKRWKSLSVRKKHFKRNKLVRTRMSHLLKFIWGFFWFSFAPKQHSGRTKWNVSACVPVSEALSSLVDIYGPLLSLADISLMLLNKSNPHQHSVCVFLLLSLRKSESHYGGTGWPGF